MPVAAILRHVQFFFPTKYNTVVYKCKMLSLPRKKKAIACLIYNIFVVGISEHCIINMNIDMIIHMLTSNSKRKRKKNIL